MDLLFTPTDITSASPTSLDSISLITDSASSLSLTPETSTTQNENNKIPHILYKTGPFKEDEIPDDTLRAINASAQNLGAKVVYFTDEQCREFIVKHFNKAVLRAYDILKPGAYKADLWRYCVLYINGGIYSDISQYVLKRLTINPDNADIVLSEDLTVSEFGYLLQISFMAATPRTNLFEYVIDKVTDDVLSHNYGKNLLDITGPRAFARHVCNYLNRDKLKPHCNTYTSIEGETITIDLAFKETGCPHNQVCGSFERVVSRINDLSDRVIKPKCCDDHFTNLASKSKTDRYNVAYEKRDVFCD